MAWKSLSMCSVDVVVIHYHGTLTPCSLNMCSVDVVVIHYHGTLTCTMQSKYVQRRRCSNPPTY